MSTGHFTKEQIDEIQQALATRAARDTHFPLVTEMLGDELIPIVQQTANKVINYSAFVNETADEVLEYSEKVANKVTSISSESTDVQYPSAKLLYDQLLLKQDKEEGKGLSTNDFTDAYETKLEGIETGAEVNVNADWNASSGDAQILNKPDLSVYALATDVAAIEGKIPEQASSTNQLADKAFVNSSISTSTATYRGSYNLVSDLSLTVSATESQIATALATKISTVDNNDYCFVQVPTSDATPTQIARIDRYKYNGTAWAFEYSLNNSGFTASQWAAINSGITSSGVTKLSGIAARAQVNVLEGVQVNGTDLTISNKKVNVDISGKADKISGATNGNFAGLNSSGNLTDSGKKATDFATAAQGTKADTAYQKPSGGIPKTDLTSAVQTSLGKADTAVQTLVNTLDSTSTTAGLTANMGKELNETKIDAPAVAGQAGQILQLDANAQPEWVNAASVGATYDSAVSDTSTNAIQNKAIKQYVDDNFATKAGHYPDLFAGFAGNLVDTRSAGTRQGPFAFRQSGGDGVNYMQKILGRTEAFNQLVGPSDTQVTIPSGHLYYAIINGTASVGTSDGTPISVTGGTDIVVDLTIEGLGLTTADQFRALHPLGYYNYNAGVLKNNAATGLETTGFNQWDEEWENGEYSQASGEPGYNPSRLRGKNYIPVFGGVAYYAKSPVQLVILSYDANKNYLGETTVKTAINGGFTPEAGVAFIRFYTGENLTTYNHDICINLSDASRNGTYEPYWKRDIVLGLNSIPCHDENNNAVVVNGLDGVGTSQDELIVENGWGTKIIKRFAEVDLSTLSFEQYQTGRYRALLPEAPKNPSSSNVTPNAVCDTFTIKSANTATGAAGEMWFDTSGSYVYCGANAAPTMGNLVYELATPKVLTLDNPIPALIEVDNLGTERRLPEDTADNPQGPFECDSNYSISTANLLRKLNS